MTDEELADLRRVEWMPSRIPVLDALQTFHPGLGSDDADLDPGLTNELRRWPEARWHPIESGFRVSVPNNGRPFDHERFGVETGGWNHSHCDNCGTHIPAMTLLWVTRYDPYVQFCVDCYAKHISWLRGMVAKTFRR